jgi:arylsulfatase A-like enzyme
MPPDLFFLLCDTARADAFSPWGGPQLSPTMRVLCEQGISYSRATSQAPWTLASTASMFTGRLPTETGISGDCFEWRDGKPTSPSVAVKSYQGEWLPEALRDRGYRTWAASCNTWVSEWGGFDRGFEMFLDLRDRTRLPKGSKVKRGVRRARRLYGKVDRGGREAVREFRRWIGSVGGGREPLFGFVNLMETHAPYDPPRPFYPYAFWKRADTRRLTGGHNKARRFLAYNARMEEPDPSYVSAIRSLYTSCARYEDRLLGEFVRTIGDRGRPAVVVVVADHGENLGEHGLFNHNSSLGETLLHVPLVVWGYRVDVGQGRVEEPVSLLGLGSWLLGLAGGDGTPVSANGPVVAEYESTVRHNGIPADIAARIDAGDLSRVPALVHHPGVAIRKGSLKYVFAANGEQSLFDVETDPNEDRDLLRSRPEAAAEFVPLREEWEKRRANQPVYDAGEPAEGEIAEHLRMLGYLD